MGSSKQWNSSHNVMAVNFKIKETEIEKKTYSGLRGILKPERVGRERIKKIEETLFQKLDTSLLAAD